MTVSLVLFVALVLAFATLVTTHVAIALGLVGRSPRWRALAAFVVLPLAPFFAWREGMRFRAGLWTFACALYAVMLVLSLR